MKKFLMIFTLIVCFGISANANPINATLCNKYNEMFQLSHDGTCTFYYQGGWRSGTYEINSTSIKFTWIRSSDGRNYPPQNGVFRSTSQIEVGGLVYTPSQCKQ